MDIIDLLNWKWNEKLGGPEARAVAQAFWTQPNDATWAEYNRVCKRYYNTTPQSEDASQRTQYRTEILFASARGEQRTMNLLPGLACAMCPVLVMAGDADPVTPIEDAQDIVAALPSQWVQFERFAHVGHGAWRDNAEAAFAVLRRYIAG